MDEVKGEGFQEDCQELQLLLRIQSLLHSQHILLDPFKSRIQVHNHSLVQ